MTAAVLAALALATAVGVTMVVWMRGARDRSHRRLVLYVYRHVDEILGARKAELQRAQQLRYYASWLNDWAGFGRLAVLLFWRAPSADVPWPPHRRRARYITLRYGVMVRGQLQDPPPVGALHLWQVHAVTLTWSTEAVANHANFEEACERGRGGIGVGAGAAGLAQALGIQWRDGVFNRTRDDANHRITFTRTYANDVPDRFELTEEVNGEAL
jgi:hypothetical protein